jgi:hypothetical protein
MTEPHADEARLRLEEDRFRLEKARLELEQSFSKKYATPLIGVLAAIVAGCFALTQVLVATIQKDREIASAQIVKDKELELARLERERRWRLDIADFVFRNREVIFSAGNTEERRRIINVMAVTFPQDVTEVLFKNLKAALPEQDTRVLEAGLDILTKRTLTTAIGGLTDGDLGKAQRAVQALDPSAPPAVRLDDAKAQLQSYVRGARTSTRIAEVAKAFASAGIPLRDQ